MHHVPFCVFVFCALKYDSCLFHAFGHQTCRQTEEIIIKYTDQLTFKCICARIYKLQFYTAIATKSDSNSTSTFPIFYYAAKPAGGSTWTFSYMVSNEIQVHAR